MSPSRGGGLAPSGAMPVDQYASTVSSYNVLQPMRSLRAASVNASVPRDRGVIEVSIHAGAEFRASP